MVFFTGKLVDGIEYDMGVDVFPVCMDTDHRLISRQMLPHEFLRDLQRQSRRDLARTEGLDDMIELHPVCFIPADLGILHLGAGASDRAPLRGSQYLLLRLVSVDHIGNGLRQTASAGKDLCDCHYCFTNSVIFVSIVRIRNFSSLTSSFVAKPALALRAI